MKLQCSCGAKYTIEVTPEMAHETVQFVCPACGVDASQFVTQLVYQQLGVGTPAVPAIAPPPPGYAPPPRAVVTAASGSPPPAPEMAPSPAGFGMRPPTPAIAPRPSIGTNAGAPVAFSPAAPFPAPVAIAPVAIAPASPANPAKPVVRINKPVTASAPVAAPMSAPAPSGGGLRIHKETTAAPLETEEVVASDPDAPKPCLRHPGELALEKCYVCEKPLCPKCMQLFGYVCSPLCRNKAESQGMDVPVFKGQKALVEAKNWRRTVWIGGSAFAVIVLFFGAWFWYEWFGCVPHTVFSVRFTEPRFSGQSAVAGKNQIVFLHGGTLARHDMKNKQPVWSHYLVDTNEVEREMAMEIKAIQASIDKANNENPDFAPRMPDPYKMRRGLIKDAEASLHLRVIGQNIWVMSSGKLTRYDWDSGKPNKEIALESRFGNLIRRGDELLFLDDSGDSLTRINLNTCETRTEDIGLPKNALARANNPAPRSASSSRTASAGLPLGVPGADSGKPLDPAKVAEQAAHLPLAARIALPATLANSANQERTLKELADDPGAPRAQGKNRSLPQEMFSLVPTKDGFVQFATRMLEEHITTRTAMKAAPAKSVLDGNLNGTKTLEAANEILNEMQRSRGGDVIEEDESKYLVKLRSPNGENEWSGEVIGSPHLYPCKTVNVIAANKTVLVFDKSNKKLWQGTLSHNVVGAARDFDDDNARYGEGPCVERNGTLYVFDQGVLTAFELANGNARWRLPSVGISGMFFDQPGMIYINTTDAGPDSIKFSRQIDISQKVGALVQKIDPKNGKVLWTAMPGGPVSYVIGNYIYTVQSYDSGDPDEESPYTPETGLETQPYVKIKLLNPKHGRVVWEHFQQRAPLDVEFDKNTIRMVFRKEVQVLKFLDL